MFTSKQRSTLRSIAQNLQPIAQVGKGGISQNMLVALSSALDSRELIKITVLNNTDDTPQNLASELASSLNAEVVCVIGHKIVLYRYSDKKGVKHIEY